MDLPNQQQEHYHYNALGLLVKKVDAEGGEHCIDYDPEGLPIRFTNPAGQCWKRSYNARNQVTSTTDPLGNTTFYAYNPLGLVGSITDPLNHTRRFMWNNHGKLSAQQDPLGRSQHYHYDSAQRLVEIKHGEGLSTRYTYDAQDRVSAITAPDGSTTQYAYTPHGLLAEVIDPQGRRTRYEYDGLSQVKRRHNPEGHSLQYHYDGERNLVGLSNENGERYHLKYDLKERLIEEVGFDGRITRYSYNAAGHLSQSLAVSDRDSGAGIATHYERDVFGRLLKETTPDGVSEFSYTPSGQLAAAKNPYRQLQWEYDAAGRMTADWQDQHVIRHHYDAAGNRVQSGLPNGETLHYHYNAAGQFTRLQRQAPGREHLQTLTQIEHDALGREVNRHHGNGLSSRQQYDPQGRLQQQRLFKAQHQQRPVESPSTGLPGHPGDTVLMRQYQYQQNGQISHINDSLRGDKHFHYVALDRLSAVEGPQPEHFIHDPAHNILAAAPTEQAATEQASTTQIKGNQLQFRGDTHYRYDAHGNRIAADRGKGQALQTRYTYNSKQQLQQIVKGKAGKVEQTIRYVYDPLGRRIGKKIDHHTAGKQQQNQRVVFLWHGDVPLQETTQTQNGDTQRRSYYFEPQSFKPIALSENGTLYHYHLDHLGTPDTLTDENGDIAWSVSYHSYGNVAVKQVNRIEQPLRFQGQYFDEESGLHYNRFRYYDPNVGQFTQQDPIGLLGGHE